MISGNNPPLKKAESMTPAAPLLAPLVVLVLWTLLMWIWMYAVRIPAVRRAGIHPDPQLPRGEQMATLPARVRWKADNYNHLFEQPVLFYALVLALALLGDVSATSLYLAWTYVGLRVLHSLWQALHNRIEVRLLIFTLSSLVLTVLAVRAAWLVF